jgi:multidrug efflux system outer membrane protein
MKHAPWLIAAALSLAGCAVPEKTVVAPTANELPATAAPVPVAPDWWTAYNDPALNALVDEVLRHNTDLARAVSRIDEARALLRLAQSERGPVVSANASAGRQRVSENAGLPLGGASPWGNTFQASLNVAYEVDLWGRIASSTAAARSELLATQVARDTLRIALAAQVVQAYAGLRALDGQVVVYERAVAAQREGLRLNRARYDAGDMSELDWRQLEAELLANETQLPRLNRARGETERALGLLLGRPPRGVIEQGIARAAAEAPPLVAARGRRTHRRGARRLPAVDLPHRRGRQAEHRAVRPARRAVDHLLPRRVADTADLERRCTGCAACRRGSPLPPGRARLPRRRRRGLQGTARRAVRA